METDTASLGKIAKHTVNAALLTATANNVDDGMEGAALLTVSGAPFIEFQINQLLRAGIKRIFVEIDTIPGALLPVADRARANGIDFDFIRSPAELNGKFGDGDLLFVMSEGIYLDDPLLSEMLAQHAPFLVTLDGREENAAYERIDLNSYWAGLALLGPASIAAIAALPEEWSISSSLLRRALQDSVLHRPLKQGLVDAKQLRKLQYARDAKALSDAVLNETAKLADGWIEKYIFAPVAVWITKILWQYKYGRAVFEITSVMLVLAALLCAYRGFAVPAAIALLLSMLSMNTRIIKLTNSNNNIKINFSATAYWTAIVSVFLVLAAYGQNNFPLSLFPALVMIGLLLLSKQSAKKGWPRLILCSPALAAVLVLIFGLLGILNIGIMFIVIGQLAALLFSSGFEGFRQRG